jgi:autotransporter-associated beta strand protein
MRRITALLLAGILPTTVTAAPLFFTGTGDVPSSAGLEDSINDRLEGYINLGLQGVGRIPASQLDAFGETFGSVSGLQITNWKKSGGGYAGSFMVLPDRGYNSGAVYSDYRTRIQQVDFSFTPYTEAGPVSPAQSQFTLNYMGGSLIRETGGTANTTGALPTASVALQVGTITSGIVPTTAGGKISIDAEGIALFKDGSGYVTDEYGPNIYYVKDGQIGAVINPPASAMPRTTGGSLFFAVAGTGPADNELGRRPNQGMEAVAITPDGKTLFTMLQSATVQDSVSGAQNRQFTRLYKYDVSLSRTDPVLVGEYVVELPRFNDKKADQTGLVPNRVAAQSEIVALDGDRLLLLSRDGNGNGNSGVTPAVFKSVMLMDLGKDSPTNIATLDTAFNYSVINGTVSNPIVAGTATLTDTTAKLNSALTPVSPVQFVNLIGQSQLSKFGLNTNDGSAASPRSAASLSEKWEGLALVSALDSGKPNDYFLFVGNDNDFLTSNLKMKSTTGSISTTAGPFGASVENDTMFLAYRLTLPAGAGDQSLVTIGSAGASASMAAFNIVDNGSGLMSGTSTYGISGSTLLAPGSVTVSRPIDVGFDGGGLNLLGHSVVLDGSVSGTGALTVFGTSSGAMLALQGNNTFEGGLEINGVRVTASQPENLGYGQVNLNAGAVLSLLQSGTFSQDAGLYVGGGTMEVPVGKEILWTGTVAGPGKLTKAGAGNLALTGASTFAGGLTVEEGALILTSSSLTQGDKLVASPVGIGTLTVKGGATLSFKEQGVSLFNAVGLHPGADDTASVLLDLGENSAEFAGPVHATAPVEIRGETGSLLTFFGATSLAGDLSVQGATVRLSESLANAPGTITLRSDGGLQALGNVQLSSTIVLNGVGRLDGGEGVLAVAGDITGTGSLRIAGISYGTVRLEGLNTYTGGTSVENSRVEVAVNGAGENVDGAFGSGDVSFKNATLGFATSSRIQNTLKLNGELTIDVAENIGELGGYIINDASGTGSLHITGGSLGALMLSGASNSYTGHTIVEGTTLRVFHGADTSLLGVGTHASGGLLPIQLDGATLQIISNPNPGALTSPTPLTGRGVLLGARGATLDVSDSSVVWTGVISGGDSFLSSSKLTVAGAAGSQIELAAANTHAGGTEVQGGVLLKVSADENLGAAGTPVTLTNGGLLYSGSGSVNWNRPLAVPESGLFDVGTRTVTLTGALSGGGVLEVGRKAYEGSTFSSTTGVLVVGASAAGFTGRTVVSGGSLLVSATDALRNSTLEAVSGGGTVGFAVPNVNVGGLAGDGALTLAPAATLSVGFNGANSRFSGVVSGGNLALVGGGTFTLTGNAKIDTAQLLVGATATGLDKTTVLDVSELPDGVLKLSDKQTLGGGGRVVGSVVTNGVFAPGNSPGEFTVSQKAVNGVSSGGNLTVGTGGRIVIEYGQRVGDSTLTLDKLSVSGVLTLDPSVKIVLSKFVDSGSWGSFLTPTSLDLSGMFNAASIVTTGDGTLSAAVLASMIEPDGKLLSRVVANTTPSNSGTLSLSIVKDPYATHVTVAGLRPLADYLLAAGNGSPSAALVRYLSVLDASATAAELNALVASLQSPVYAEAQRLSLRRTAAVSETLQGRLVRGPKSLEDGWSAWSETYGWSFNRSATAIGDSWNGRNFGEILGVQHRQAGLTLGLFGAAGTTSASFSGPSSSLSGESFHGGAFVHVESGSRFLDASILAGSAEQTAVRNVSLGPVSGQGRARFSTGEYAGHLRFGVQLDEVAQGLTLKPSLAVLFNGYSQGAATESGLDGVGVVTQKKDAVAWQTRLGFEALKKAQLGGKSLDLLASAYWVRDANKNSRSVETRFNGSSAPEYSAEGSALGANALEVGVGAGVTLTPRTSARLNGVWQVREGSSQPGVNLGVTVQF